LDVWLSDGGDPVRLAYQPPDSSTFLSQQTSQQYFSLRTNQHQPNEQTEQRSGALALGRRLSERKPSANGGRAAEFLQIDPEMDRDPN
jgi:hypothetical protein